MRKHILDGKRARHGQKLMRFARIDRARGTKPRAQVEMLRQAPRTRDAVARLRRYLQLARQA